MASDRTEEQRLMEAASAQAVDAIAIVTAEPNVVLEDPATYPAFERMLESPRSGELRDARRGARARRPSQSHQSRRLGRSL